MARFTLKKALITAKCGYDNKKILKNRTEPINDDGVLFRGLLAGDLHTDGDPWRDRNNRIRDVLTGIAAYPLRLDAAIIAGDITNSGEWEEYDKLVKMINGYYKTNTPLIVSMGNHDSQSVNWEPYFSEGCDNFRRFCKTLGITTDKNYFSLRVKDQKIICLGTEYMVADRSWLTDEQLRFLENELKDSSSKKEAVIVVNHQPLEGMNGASVTKDPKAIVGEQNDALDAILKKAAGDGARVIYVSGHTHKKLAEDTIEDHNGIICVNTPSILHTQGGGQCIILEIYKNKTVLYTENVTKDGQKITVRKEF